MSTPGASTSPEEILRDNRPLLLALEAIGWVHMTGKSHPDFLANQGGQIGNYNQKKWHQSLSKPWNSFWGWLSSSYQIFKFPSSFEDFLEKFDQGSSEKNAVGLLQAAHAMASGIEKNLPNNASQYLVQDTTHMWLTTAFGYPVRNLVTNPSEIFKDDNAWRAFISRIEKFLVEIESIAKDFGDDIDRWWNWRETAVGQNGWLRKAFNSTLAETRWPNNDIALWDQSYVAAALFKSAAAGAMVAGSQFKWDNVPLKQETRWRLFTVGIGADHYESRAVRIGDWTAARCELDKFLDKVRRLVEVDLAVGSLLYRDTQVVIFSFPGQHLNGMGGLDDSTAKNLFEFLRKEIDSIAQSLALETPPYYNLSSSSRSLILMSEEIVRARENSAVPIHRSWQISSAETNGHICPVCGVRLTGDDRNKDQPCPTCKTRRGRRLKDWLSGKTRETTIWISEVADRNDRLALLTFSLPVRRWLDGSCVDSLRAQAASEWCRNNPNVQQSSIKPDTAYKNLLQYIETRVSQPLDRVDPVLRKLQDGYQHETKWEDFFAKIVEDRAKERPKWDGLSPTERAQWLVHQLLRKNASPGRLHRFWRTTEEFFESLLSRFLEIAAKDANRWRVRRLVIKPDQQTSNGWQDGEVYNGQCQGAPISLLYRAGSQDFLTICNVARLLAATASRDDLKDKTCEIKSDNERAPRTLTIGSVKEAESLGVYYPVIPLELSPERFRALVPLAASSECLDAAIEAWSHQFARVWDRMPLRIGVVAFSRKTPFQAVIEATRNLESQLEVVKEEIWRVKSRVKQESVVVLNLVRPDGQQELHAVPVHLPDGRLDVFYPYLAVEDDETRFPLDFRTPQGQIYRHVQDLRRGDGIMVYPSRIATLFLEDTGRRFDNASGQNLSDWLRLRELWQLLSGLGTTTTALRGAWATLDEARRRWLGLDQKLPEEGRDTWLTLARNVIGDQLGARGAVLDAIVDAARMDLLEPCLDWHMRVLKLSLGEVSK